ncbi:hypothetical protein Tco_1328491, partial [Tanacetum coccineum]
MERFKNVIFKQHEVINDRRTEMFGLLKELTNSRTPKKVLTREEAKILITKNVNYISLARGEEKRSDKTDEVLDDTVKPTVTEMEIPLKEAEGNNETKNKPVKRMKRKKWRKFIDSLSKTRVGKVKGKTYNVLPRGPVYEAILKKKITKKEDIRGNFKIPCSIGGLKHVNALGDQGSDVNVIDYTSPPPNQGNCFSETQKDLKICEANNEKSSVNEPPEVELKDLPPHLEYAFLEGNDKLPVIIAKDLRDEEKAALIK